jgi:hypothetical protein
MKLMVFSLKSSLKKARLISCFFFLLLFRVFLYNPLFGNRRQFTLWPGPCSINGTAKRLFHSWTAAPPRVYFEIVNNILKKYPQSFTEEFQCRSNQLATRLVLVSAR